MEVNQNRSSQLLATLKGDELQKACLKWLLEPEPYADLQPRDMPVEPQSVGWNEYKSYTKKQRQEIDAKFHVDNPEVMKYFDDLHMTYQHNKGYK